MTTNSPNPVDGDVQALIAWLEEGIICSSDYGFTGNVLKSMQIALEALTAPTAQLLRQVELPQAFAYTIEGMEEYIDGWWLRKDDVIEALRQQGYEVKS